MSSTAVTGGVEVVSQSTGTSVHTSAVVFPPPAVSARLEVVVNTDSSDNVGEASKVSTAPMSSNAVTPVPADAMARSSGRRGSSDRYGMSKSAVKVADDTACRGTPIGRSMPSVDEAEDAVP